MAVSHMRSKVFTGLYCRVARSCLNRTAIVISSVFLMWLQMRICAVCETAFDGMMASVDGGKTWVHVVCAKYHPHYSVNYWDSGYFREVVVKTGEDTDDFLYTPGVMHCDAFVG